MGKVWAHSFIDFFFLIGKFSFDLSSTLFHVISFIISIYITWTLLKVLPRLHYFPRKWEMNTPESCTIAMIIKLVIIFVEVSMLKNNNLILCQRKGSSYWHIEYVIYIFDEEYSNMALSKSAGKKCDKYICCFLLFNVFVFSIAPLLSTIPWFCFSLSFFSIYISNELMIYFVILLPQPYITMFYIFFGIFCLLWGKRWLSWLHFQNECELSHEKKKSFLFWRFHRMLATKIVGLFNYTATPIFVSIWLLIFKYM